MCKKVLRTVWKKQAFFSLYNELLDLIQKFYYKRN